MEGETITIPINEYANLVDAALFLNALEQAGVDNWEWYGAAQELYAEMQQEDNE